MDHEENGAPPFFVEPDSPIEIPRRDAATGAWSVSDGTQISQQRYTDAECVGGNSAANL